MIQTAQAKKTETIDGVIQLDKRGHHMTRPRATEESTKDLIREHIQSYPTIDCYYNRTVTSKKYLPYGLTITKMYNFYVKWMQTRHEDQRNIVKRQTYSRILESEFNYEFWSEEHLR